MITKLKYVGVEETDLVEIYTLFVRSLLEYCCVAWHSSITQAQSYDIERVQCTALKVILGQSYTMHLLLNGLAWIHYLTGGRRDA